MPTRATGRTEPVVRRLVPRLLAWFSTQARDLPWRRTRDPYAIWVSEIMLQQTQVKTVIPYWERWMRALPTIESVARASSAKLHKLWEGLGYYTRVRNLQRAAQQIVARHRGRFPEDFDALLALPGVGRYTAGAIASIAFNQPRPVLDGNVIRVLTRVFGIATNPRERKTNTRLWQLAEALVRHAARITPPAPERNARQRTTGAGNPNCSHLNQSLMELGAVICTPRAPKCDACPVAVGCIAFRRCWQEKLPNSRPATPVTPRRFVAFVVERDGKFLVRQRPPGGVNAQLWEFPNIEIPASPPARPPAKEVRARRLIVKSAAFAEFRLLEPEPFFTLQHSITRYRIRLEAWRAQSVTSSARIPGRWLSAGQLRRLAFTSAHRRILQQLQRPP